MLNDHGSVACVECGDPLLRERAELGYSYCTKPACQAHHRRGPTVTAIPVNKSADSYTVADEHELAARAERGEFGAKNTTLGVRPVPPSAEPNRARPRNPRPVAATRRRASTPEQEKLVWTYHEMGLTPAQITERARRAAPRLHLDARTVADILATLPRR